MIAGRIKLAALTLTITLIAFSGLALAQSERPVKITGADGVDNAAVSMQTAANGSNVLPLIGNFVFNGTTWDRMPGTTLGLTVATAARGTAITNLSPVYIGCDSSNSGSVTQGQLQAVRCDTQGRLALTQSGLGGDGVGLSTFAQFVASNGGTLTPATVGYLLNNTSGTLYDRSRSTSLANFSPATTLTGRNSLGAALSEHGSRWSVISNPAAGSQATASIASEASVRHVADCVSFSAASTTAPVLTALTVNLRDGATGAGTIIWTKQVVIPASTGQNVLPFGLCGLNLVGTTATAMTLEFSASLANLIEEASITGFNVN